MEDPQYTDAQLSDGTTLRFQGQLSPDQVKAKVQAYRAKSGGGSQPSPPTAQQPQSLIDRLLQSPAGRFTKSLASGAAGMIPNVAPSVGDMASMIANASIDAGDSFSKAGDSTSRAIQAIKANQPGAAVREGANAAGYGAAGALAPFGGSAVKQAGEQFGEGDIAGGAGSTTALLAPMAAPHIAPTASAFFSPLTESSHRILSDTASRAKQMIGQGGSVHQAVSKQFEALSNDVAAADYADGKKIDISPIWEKVMQHADDYAAGKTTPNFNAVADAIQKRPTELTFKELHDLSKEVGSRWEKAQSGSRDEGAAGSAMSDIKSLLDDRAKELGRDKQWDAAKTIWSNLKEYQGDGVLSKLTGAVTDPVAPGQVPEGGKRFFDVLNDPANKPKLNEINKAFEPYGMPADYFNNMRSSHMPLYNMVNPVTGTGGMAGKVKTMMRAVKEAPLTSVPAVVGGAAVGSLGGSALGPVGSGAGGAMGAMTGLKLAERLSAARAVSDMGVPKTPNAMAEAAGVKPVGDGSKPTPPATPVARQGPLSPKPQPKAASPTVNEQVVTSAARSLGYDAKTARDMARQAIQNNPHDEAAAIAEVAGKKKPVAEKPKINVPPSKPNLTKRGKDVLTGPHPTGVQLDKAESVSKIMNKKREGK